MPRDLSILMAMWKGKRPPAVLSRDFSTVVPLGRDEDGWPSILLMMPGSGSLTVLWWDELERRSANEAPA